MVQDNYPGVGCLIAIGRWGGFNLDAGAFGIRLSLGFVALTFTPFDGDALIDIAARGIDTFAELERCKEQHKESPT